MLKPILAISISLLLSGAVQAQVSEHSENRELAKDSLAAPPDAKARAKAHRKVEKDKRVLEAKLREGAPPQEVHEAKQKLQTDRVEKNREDYKNTKDVKEVRP